MGSRTSKDVWCRLWWMYVAGSGLLSFEARDSLVLKLEFFWSDNTAHCTKMQVRIRSCSQMIVKDL